MDTQKFGSHLEGKLVVVTGASKGIGRGLAQIIAPKALSSPLPPVTRKPWPR